MATRITLLKFVLEVLPTYSMVNNMIPKSYLKEIHCIHRNFIWSDGTDKWNIHTMKWEAIMKDNLLEVLFWEICISKSINALDNCWVETSIDIHNYIINNLNIQLPFAIFDIVNDKGDRDLCRLSVNVSFGEREEDLMVLEGLPSTRMDAFCVKCESKVGWKFESDHVEAPGYRFNLERSKILEPGEDPNMPPPPPQDA
ncbi:hypothetical protein KIW84_034215 [Lathyrus oleraceus]|uniref:Yippee domain-containing protein n=1 Tax=Pisum sativum TaxID=3888 RepID=A0A9D4Y0Q4_PEA|nr:hypothetical protein KIW84_034215 [Pisum sativum]